MSAMFAFLPCAMHFRCSKNAASSAAFLLLLPIIILSLMFILVTHYSYHDCYCSSSSSSSRRGARPALAPKVWSAQGHLGMQSEDHLAYTFFCLATTALLIASALRIGAGQPPVLPGCVVAALVAYGPIAFALLLCLRYDKMSWRWPFHHERLLGAFGFFAVAGWLSCVVPLYDFVSRLCEV